jgi:hypothetical protein
MIAGYFGSGAAGHPNKGYTVVPPYGQANFTNENFPGSVQTQVTAINNIGTTVGFWSNSNLGVGMDSNFGFTDVGGVFTNVNNCDYSSGVQPAARGQQQQSRCRLLRRRSGCHPRLYLHDRGHDLLSAHQ